MLVPQTVEMARVGGASVVDEQGTTAKVGPSWAACCLLAGEYTGPGTRPPLSLLHGPALLLIHKILHHLRHDGKALFVGMRQYVYQESCPDPGLGKVVGSATLAAMRSVIGEIRVK